MEEHDALASIYVVAAHGLRVPDLSRSPAVTHDENSRAARTPWLGISRSGVAEGWNYVDVRQFNAVSVKGFLRCAGHAGGRRGAVSLEINHKLKAGVAGIQVSRRIGVVDGQMGEQDAFAEISAGASPDARSNSAIRDVASNRAIDDGDAAHVIASRVLIELDASSERESRKVNGEVVCLLPVKCNAALVRAAHTVIDVSGEAIDIP
jgi:hypothetical protein